MKHALITSKNLIGDSLYIQPALEEWARDNQDYEIDLLTNNDHVACIYRHMGIPNLRVVFERMYLEYDFEFVFDVSRAFKISDELKCHISTAYGRMLSYEIEPRRVRFIPSEAHDHEKGLILVSMHSASCASRGKPPGPPNKMLSWEHWAHILPVLRQYGKIAVIGGPKDLADVDITDDEYYLGIDLDKTARMMRDGRLLVTIDNGMGHLAATQQTPTVLFYPSILGMHYIVPSGNRNLTVLQMNPLQISVDDAVLFVREGVRRVWNAA